MSQIRHQLSVCAVALVSALMWGGFAVHADPRRDDRDGRDEQRARKVFVIAMENHNWTQPASQTSPGQILGNSAAPYINSLVTPGNPNAAQVSYASNYLNAGANIHPSEPNYIWAEAGSNLGITNDADPYPNNVSNTPNSLSNYLLH